MDIDTFLASNKEETIRKQIILIEFVSIFFTLVTCISSAYLSAQNESMLAMAVSADSLLDILAYTVIIWRFLNKSELNSVSRDRIAQIFFSILFFITAVCIEYESVKNLILNIKPTPSSVFVFISISQSLVFSLISVAKCMLCQKLSVNSSLLASAINSLMASLGNLSMAISMSLFFFQPSIWYLDSMFGFFMGIFLFIYGTKLFVSSLCSF